MAGILSQGKAYDWGTIRIVLFGRVIIGAKGINWEESQEKTNEYGQGYEPVARGRGNREYQGSVTLSELEYKALEDAILLNGLSSILDIEPFDIAVTFDNGTKVVNYLLLRCEFTGNPFSAAQGDTMLERELPIALAKVDRLP